MDFVIENAMKNSGDMYNADGFKVGTANIKVIGCGGADNNMVNWLHKKGLIHDPSVGVNILHTGLLDKKITVSGCLASKSAAVAIEKAGGRIIF